MENLGKAKVKVELLSALPNIRKDQRRYNVDVSSFGWNNIKDTPYINPLLTDNITDVASGFSASFPSKRKYPLNNYMKGGNGARPLSPGTPYIEWETVTVADGIVESIQGEYLKQQGDNQITPKWLDEAREGVAPAQDALTIEKFVEGVSTEGLDIFETPPFTEETRTEEEIATTYYVQQTLARDSLFWGIESDAFLGENMPFWVHISRNEASPASFSNNTMFIISLGVGNDLDAYDLIIADNAKPRLIDYSNGRAAVTNQSGSGGGSGSGSEEAPPPPYKDIEFADEASTIKEGTTDIIVGFMTIAGRLVVFVNDSMFLYNRFANEEGEVREAKIAPTSLRMYGTNAQVSINVSLMTFAPLGIVTLPIPAIPPDQEEEGSGGAAASIPVFEGMKNDGKPDGSVAKLTTDPSEPQQLYGVDSRSFTDPAGSNNPSGFGFHQLGEVALADAGSAGIDKLGSTNFYLLAMKPDNLALTTPGREGPGGGAFDIYNGGAPYFFRIKGFNETKRGAVGAAGVDVTEDVLSLSESTSASDYYDFKKSATITLYNKGGKYDYLRDQQYGVRLYFGWGDGDLQRTLTGVIVSATSGESPGEETLEVRCEDYMFILKNTPIINSPYYDGMISYYAIEDVVKRAGVLRINKDWDDDEEYFLPSGYVFTKPSVKFETTQSLYECARWMAQKDESFIYFDEDGEFHVTNLPGGLFSTGAAQAPVKNFTRNPEAASADTIIIGDKTVEYSLESTSNTISIMTVNKDSRLPVIVALDPGSIGLQDRLLFRKPLLINQAALGDEQAAKLWAAKLGQRVFYIILKMSFRSVGGGATVQPLEFITVDGQEFRVMSVNRKYNVENNTFEAEYSAEWLGGKG